MVEAQGYQILLDGSLSAPKSTPLKTKIPSELVPHCPHCGKPMSMNLRADDTFIEDEGWHRAAKNPNAFYSCINQGQAVCPPEIERQAVCIHADIGAVIAQL